MPRTPGKYTVLVVSDNGNGNKIARKMGMRSKSGCWNEIGRALE